MLASLLEWVARTVCAPAGALLDEVGQDVRVELVVASEDRLGDAVATDVFELLRLGTGVPVLVRVDVEVGVPVLLPVPAGELVRLLGPVAVPVLEGVTVASLLRLELAVASPVREEVLVA